VEDSDSGNEYDSDNPAVLFLSNLGISSNAYYVSQHFTLEYQYMDGKSILFAVTEQFFCSLESSMHLEVPAADRMI
jgi:hypothetical protein